MTKAEKEEKFAARVHKEAIRLYIFSQDCPRHLNPYNYYRTVLMDLVVNNYGQLSAKAKTRFMTDFLNSVTKQIPEKGYVSNHQLEIIEKVLEDNDFALEHIKEEGEVEKKNRFDYIEAHYDELCKKFEGAAEYTIKLNNAVYAAGFHSRGLYYD